MDPITTGAIIGAGSSIASTVGSLFGAKSAADDQREFAQKGIRWRVKDAELAGIHPLYALGAQVAPWSPTPVGDWSGIAEAGQNVGRVIDATRTASERQQAVDKTVMDLQLTNMKLQNDLLSSQVAVVRSQVGPPMPGPGDRMLIDGQAQTNRPTGVIPADAAVVEQPLKRTVGDPRNLSVESGPVADMGYTRTQSGFAPVMSQDAQQRLEDDFLGMLAWNLRNRVLPSLTFNQNYPAGGKVDKGKAWIFDPYLQEYRMVDPRDWEGRLNRTYGGY